MKTYKIIETIGQRWPLLEKLYEKDYYVSELATTLKKKLPEISKQLHQLEKAQLAKSTKTSQRRKTYSLTPRGRKAAEFTQYMESKEPNPSKLTKPNKQFWKDLKLKLNSKNKWVAEAAQIDLEKLCQETEVWELDDDLWQYLSQQLNALNTNKTPTLNKTLNCISIIARNAYSNGEKTAVNHIKNTFYERLTEMIGTEQFENEWTNALACLKSLTPENEIRELAQKKLTETFELEDDEKFRKISNLLINELEYETHINTVREWLYTQMEKPNPKAAERAYHLYQILLKKPTTNKSITET